MECSPGFDKLRPASFRGVHFYVESDTGSYGRRIVTHEYAMRDDPFPEDLGRKAEKWKVKGYVVGENAEAQKNAIVAACRMRGAAMLQLPAEPARMAVLQTLSVSRSRDVYGMFVLEFEFGEAGSSPALTPIIVFASAITLGVPVAVTAFTDLYSSSFRGYDVLQYVTDRAITRVQTFASDVVSTLQSTPVDDTALAAALVRDATDMFQFAANYVRPTNGDPDPSSIVQAVSDLMAGLSDALVVNNAMPAFKAMAQFSVLEDEEVTLPTSSRPWVTAASLPYSASDIADIKNAAAFNGIVRSFGLIGYARSIADYEFKARGAAIQARADLVELTNAQLVRFTHGEAVKALVAARDYAVKAVTKQMADISPVVIIEAPQSAPSLYWAYRLYEDVERATELADRNGVSTPAFMPVQFEALAR